MFRFLPLFLSAPAQSITINKTHQGWRHWHPLLFAVLAAFGMTILLNGPFFHAVADRIPGQTILQLSLAWLLFSLNLLLLLVFGIGQLQKPVLLLLFFCGALSLYFMDSFGVLIDKSMLQNALETDTAEATALLSLNLGWTVITLMVFPLLLCGLIRLRALPLKTYLKHWALAVTLVLLSQLLLVGTAYAELAPFFRNFREVKHLALPISPISAAAAVSGQLLKTRFPDKFSRLGLDAKQKTAKTAKARLLVLVLGETARADHFQLNGYQRPTNPKLSQAAVYSFRDVSACGTATAHSVPCMFSGMGREHYEEAVAKNSSNVLDILQFAGVQVSWLDNNSGCKGVCDRVEHQFLFQQHPLCAASPCPDNILLQALAQQLSAGPQQQDRLIVLHQLGSHGPEYYRRSSNHEKQFLPECRDKQLQLCPQQQVINAYDNSIVATDLLLAALIKQLEQQQHYQSTMLYLSDHGESLGENGVYLHGLPYWLAPKAQTQVPMIWWLSAQSQQALQLQHNCLLQRSQQSASHDNLFHSLLGHFAVQTALYQPKLDLFRPCS
ncbi:phosphoethanolamine transferase [Rheinheimera sp.]|uniref:phosphoethanolamine transferase n=1 Tax=Rheinheimera sp. TaxID=1869214 RepID=UPI0027B88669|nr:phosphoethanolamine--lipid A transferase [Rheinheimera sp.]